MDGLSLVAQTSRSTTAAGGGTGADAVKTYNKSSFFDEISCDVLDRAAGTYLEVQYRGGVQWTRMTRKENGEIARSAFARGQF